LTNKAKFSIAAVLILFSVWFFFTPHLTVSAMKSAAEARDAAKLSSYVNFPALKDSLKASFNAKMVSEIQKKKDGNPFSALGVAMAAALINPMIDALVTPESLAMLMEGEKPGHERNTTASAQSEPNTETVMSYESFDRFIVTIKKKEKAGEPIGFVFNRDSLFSWKLSAIRLPN